MLDQHECFTFQIKPDVVKTGLADYYLGKIYSAKWINESISKGKLLPGDEFFLAANTNEDLARKLNVSKKKKYTIMEGIRLYDYITN